MLISQRQDLRSSLLLAQATSIAIISHGEKKQEQNSQKITILKELTLLF